VSTMEYYSEICRRSEPSQPEISIESLDHHKAVSYLGIEGEEESWSQFDEYHRAALKRLEVSGADFALIASNTPHHRLEAIIRGVRIPVLSIFEAAAQESARIGARRVLILGTALTMGSRKLREQFAKYGVEAAAPDNPATRSKTIELLEDLQLGKLEGSAERLGIIAKASFPQPYREQPVVCLACTELPLAFPEVKSLPTFNVDGILYINSTIVHVNSALHLALDKDNR